MCFSISSFADDKYKLDTVDFFASPKGGVGAGTFSAGEIDHGNFATVSYGGRLGFKVGPLLLGGDYMEGYTTAEASNAAISDADRRRYPLPDHTSTQSIGASAGINMDRLNFWVTYYPIETMKKTAIVAGTSFDHTYHGSGLAAEVTIRAWDLVHVGLFYHQIDMKYFSSNHASDLADKAALDPTMQTVVYGISLSYLIPYSRVKEFIK